MSFVGFIWCGWFLIGFCHVLYILLNPRKRQWAEDKLDDLHWQIPVLSMQAYYLLGICGAILLWPVMWFGRGEE